MRTRLAPVVLLTACLVVLSLVAPFIGRLGAALASAPPLLRRPLPLRPPASSVPSTLGSAPQPATDTSAIYGQLIANTEPASNLQVTLHQYRGPEEDTVVLTTTTTLSGTYEFANPPTPPEGWTYYVCYGPNTKDKKYVYLWNGPNVPNYQVGQRRSGGVLNVVDVSLVAPMTGTVSFPVAFRWAARPSANDTYALRLADLDTALLIVPGYPVGYTDAVTITTPLALPGIEPGKHYIWDIRISDSANPTSYGLSYSYRDIVFQFTFPDTPTVTPSRTRTATPTSTVTPTPSPTRTPTPTSTRSPTTTASPTRSLTPTRTSSPTVTVSASPTPTRTVTRTATATATPTRTATASPPSTTPSPPPPSETASPTGTGTPSATVTVVTRTPTLTVSPSRTATPSSVTGTPSATPTQTRTTPTRTATLEPPTAIPALTTTPTRTTAPTGTTTVEAPTASPTASRTVTPTGAAAASPTVTPTRAPAIGDYLLYLPHLADQARLSPR